MRIVMTGATSFVGAATVRAALADGHQVIAVVRPGSAKLDVITRGNEPALADGRLVILENDLAVPEALPEKIKEPCDVFFHFGWGGSGSDSRLDEALQESNLRNALHTVRAAKKLGCRRFLFSGSQAEYGLHRDRMDEETVCSPKSVYGAAKLRMREEGQSLCKALDMEYIHVRIFSVYGPGDHPWTLVESCLDAFLNERQIALGACAQQWNFLYIEDLAEAMCALANVSSERLKTEKNPVYNLAGAETRTLRSFVEEIHSLCGDRGEPVYGVRPENAEGAVNLIPDTEKLTKVTGWKPKVGFAEGIKKTMDARSRKDIC